jgi:hypothetical protein
MGVNTEDLGKPFWLSTEGFYFKYRKDRLDPEIKRATLFNERDEKVYDLRVSAGYGMPGKDHVTVINYFETMISINETAE